MVKDRFKETARRRHKMTNGLMGLGNRQRGNGREFKRREDQRQRFRRINRDRQTPAGEWQKNQSVNQSNIRLLTRRITCLTQTQAGFTEELRVGKIRITNEKC